MDGLVWKQDCKKEPIAYGVYKLIVGCVVEDDKVSVDDLQEKIQEFEDEVQSVDILSFNKIWAIKQSAPTEEIHLLLLFRFKTYHTLTFFFINSLLSFWTFSHKLIINELYNIIKLSTIYN